MKRYDTFWSRFFALWVDGVILQIIVWLIGFFPSSNSLIFHWVGLLTVSGIPYLYSIFMIGEYGQTFGKMLMKIKVVDFVTEDKIGYHPAFMREMIPLFLISVSNIMGLIMFYDVDLNNYEMSGLEIGILAIPAVMQVTWAILEIVTMLLDDKRRAFHDKIANTVVIQIP